MFPQRQGGHKSLCYVLCQSQSGKESATKNENVKQQTKAITLFVLQREREKGTLHYLLLNSFWSLLLSSRRCFFPTGAVNSFSTSSLNKETQSEDPIKGKRNLFLLLPSTNGSSHKKERALIHITHKSLKNHTISCLLVILITSVLGLTLKSDLLQKQNLEGKFFFCTINKIVMRMIKLYKLTNRPVSSSTQQS